jgi:hypothetical protein
MDQPEREVVDPLEIVDSDQDRDGERQRTMSGFVNAKRLTSVLSHAPEDESPKVASGPRLVRQHPHETGRGGERNRLGRLEPVQPYASNARSLEHLGKKPGLAAARFSRDERGRRSSPDPSMLFQLHDLVELLSATDERRANLALVVQVDCSPDRPSKEGQRWGA